MEINGRRLLDRLHTLEKFTDTPGNGVTRFSYGDQDKKARKYILDTASSMGCSISIDALHNIRIGLPFNRSGRKTVMAGSHIDTVRNGGWLDGAYGVCGALEVMETISEYISSGKYNEKDFSCNYEAVIFAEEEGSVFGSTMTGSKFITGVYGEDDLDKLVDHNGTSLRQILNNPDISSLPWDFDSIKSMLELHIEQGPVLDRKGISLGIVDSIFGMRVIEVTLSGIGNHAGATPMSERYDAMTAAAECILAVEKTARSDIEERIVATAGKLEIMPNCSNVIPETVIFTVEVRDKDEEKINRFTDRIINQITDISQRRKVSCSILEHSKSSPLRLAGRLIDDMARHAESQKLSYMIMDSGAVHDACMIAKYADTGMIFVPSIAGRSHVPEENTDDASLITGVQFLMDTILYELK